MPINDVSRTQLIAQANDAAFAAVCRQRPDLDPDSEEFAAIARGVAGNNIYLAGLLMPDPAPLTDSRVYEVARETLEDARRMEQIDRAEREYQAQDAAQTVDAPVVDGDFFAGLRNCIRMSVPVWVVIIGWLAGYGYMITDLRVLLGLGVIAWTCWLDMEEAE